MTSIIEDSKTTDNRRPARRSPSEEMQDHIIINALLDRISELELSVAKLGRREPSGLPGEDMLSRWWAYIRSMTSRPS